MAANVTAKRIFRTTTGTTQEIHSLQANVRQIAITNPGATAIVTAKPFFASTPAAALAAATGAAAVTSLVDDAYVILPGKREVITKSPKSSFVAIQVIADTAASPYTVVGSDFFD